MKIKMDVPGWLWVLLIVVAIGVLQGDMFAGKEWAPVIVLVLTAILKAMQTYPDRFGLTKEDFHPALDLDVFADPSGSTRGMYGRVQRADRTYWVTVPAKKSRFWSRFLLG